MWRALAVPPGGVLAVSPGGGPPVISAAPALPLQHQQRQLITAELRTVNRQIWVYVEYKTRRIHRAACKVPLRILDELSKSKLNGKVSSVFGLDDFLCYECKNKAEVLGSLRKNWEGVVSNDNSCTDKAQDDAFENEEEVQSDAECCGKSEKEKGCSNEESLINNDVTEVNDDDIDNDNDVVFEDDIEDDDGGMKNKADNEDIMITDLRVSDN
uniref:Uncharacterized protein n=1 Tax=Amphimedon queenslandica TaxID=400682 RepID=A0A1X7UN44_AMPQE